MKKMLSLLLVLSLLLCACGTQSTEAPAPIEPTVLQHQPDAGTAAPTIPEYIVVHTAPLDRESISVEVRLQVVTENGTIKYIDLQAQAVEFHNDRPAPLYNQVNGVDIQDVQEIWIRSNEFNLTKVNCCMEYLRCDDGWFKVTCNANHLLDRDIPVMTYQLVDDSFTVRAFYLSLRF